jgi:pimeloyl-ACP methyl ester carboxylesterase
LNPGSGRLPDATERIAADPVANPPADTRAAFNTLRAGKLSAATVAILEESGLERLARRAPDAAVRRLHGLALESGRRAHLSALAELSYFAGNRLRDRVKQDERRRARDFYLGAALYAWLFLFDEAANALPGPLDNRLAQARDFYNQSLERTLLKRSGINWVVALENGRRRLPVGDVELHLDSKRFPAPLEQFEHFLPAAEFLVRGLTVRNREEGIGVPVICVNRWEPGLEYLPSAPATVVLRGPRSLAEISDGTVALALEVYSPFNDSTILVDDRPVPLAVDLTSFRAYTLNQRRIWNIGRLRFLGAARHAANQLILHQPYSERRIPVVFVHGTFSSPVVFLEMVNNLTANPVFRERYQIWSFLYGSGNPLLFTAADLRRVLKSEVERLDSRGTNVNLRQMVIIGHSQGGLLAKCTAIDTGDRLWRLVSNREITSLELPASEREALRELVFFESLPFIKRVIFIATPHRGSCLSGSFARRLARKFVELPGAIARRASHLLKLSQGSKMGEFLEGPITTSIDGMSTRNPALLAVAGISVARHIKAHSIIATRDETPLSEEASDGIVAYASAHLENVESELIVRSGHSCLNHPAAIEEVRRILMEHLGDLESKAGLPVA